MAARFKMSVFEFSRHFSSVYIPKSSPILAVAVEWQVVAVRQVFKGLICSSRRCLYGKCWRTSNVLLSERKFKSRTAASIYYTAVFYIAVSKVATSAAVYEKIECSRDVRRRDSTGLDGTR
jgi:hypothetical protein